MAVSVGLSSQEKYLVALIQDESGIDLAEFLWEDPTADNKEQLFRCWDFQYAWWRDTFAQGKPVDRPTLVIDSCGRAVGKTMSIIVRSWAFPIQHPGGEMVVTAPNWSTSILSPHVSRTASKRSASPGRYFPRRPGLGFKHRPFQVNFTNGAKILGRIPQRDGKGVKGLHPLRLEMDEAQDFPQPGWIELIETLRHGEEHAQWRAHGVSKGVRDEFYRHSMPDSGWTVHVVTGMHRPHWSDQERDDKIEAYGSRDSADYKRNIMGQHGDATNPLFVLHRLMATVDDDRSSEYNTDVYYYRRILDEMRRNQPIEYLVDIPGSHKKWKDTWAGMDVGMTNHPSEILVFGEESVKGTPDVILRLLSRFHLERIRSADQRTIIELLFDFYNFRRFTIDRGGLGLPLYQELQDGAPKLMGRINGYTADQKVLVGWQEHGEFEDPDDNEIRRVAKEYGYDLLREYVDSKRMIMPFDRELLGEWQGQTWTREQTQTTAYGKKTFARGRFHTLDAAAMMIVGKELQTLDTISKLQQRAGVRALKLRLAGLYSGHAHPSGEGIANSRSR